MSIRRSLHDHGLWILSSLAFAACQAPATNLREPASFVSPDLASRRPVEVAVLPVKASCAAPEVVVRAMRRAAYDALLERKYTPVGMDYVDAAIPASAGETDGRVRDVDAVLPLLKEDAVLAATIRGFDQASIFTAGLIILGADFALIERSSGARLWSVQIDRQVPVRAAHLAGAPENEILERAVRDFVGEAFTSLPTKVPPPGAAPVEPPVASTSTRG
jgi:hypothetical protein